MTKPPPSDLYRTYVNPDLVNLLETFDYRRTYIRAKNFELYDEAGHKYLDFLSGFGVHNLGHNPPSVVDALQIALASDGASMLNIDTPQSAARLAECLTQSTHSSLCRTIFANSGSEAVETAIRATRAATGRTSLVTCHAGFHGFTTGAMALMGDAASREHFGPLLPGILAIPFGDVEALRKICNSHRPAAFFVEPIQAEGGIVMPDPDYLAQASQICHDNGCLFVIDEIQTGLGRTGSLFATDFAEVKPDLLLVGKALSGGLIPVSALLMTTDVWKRAFSGPERCLLDSSTCSGGLLAMTAGLAVMSALQEQRLPAHAAKQGQLFLDRLNELSKKHDIIQNIRGRGLLLGIEFKSSSGIIPKMIPAKHREGLYAYVISAILLRDHGIIVQPCSLAKDVLRLEPPLTIGLSEIDYCVKALDAVLSAYPSHTSTTVAAIRKTILKGSL